MRGAAVTFLMPIFNLRQEKSNMEFDDLINGLKHMANDHKCCRGTIESAIQELERLASESKCLQKLLTVQMSWNCWTPKDDNERKKAESEYKEALEFLNEIRGITE
jgi:hypothetical protein